MSSSDVPDRSWRWRLATVTAYAIAIAWVEAAVVYYLRTLVDRVEPYQANPLPDVSPLGVAELVREIATLVMLGAVGALAGRTGRERLGYASVAFGLWDVWYYVFLRIMTSWPHSLFDWDVLFLLPLPWWGPVLAPMLIAIVMIIGGILLVRPPDASVRWPPRWTVVASGAGVIAALGIFMGDAIRALPGGREAVRTALPQAFPWPLFLVALTALAMPAVVRFIPASRKRSATPDNPPTTGPHSL